MQELVFDTSALISLEVVNLMNEASELFRVFIPKKVHEELKEVAKYVDEGEAEALELAKEIEADYLICDDYESF